MNEQDRSSAQEAADGEIGGAAEEETGRLILQRRRCRSQEDRKLPICRQKQVLL